MKQYQLYCPLSHQPLDESPKKQLWDRVNVVFYGAVKGPKLRLLRSQRLFGYMLNTKCFVCQPFMLTVLFIKKKHIIHASR